MVKNAISMRVTPDKWTFGDNVDVSKIEFITLFEACKKWNLDMEVFSEETGAQFQEHIKVINGNVVCNDCVDYLECYVDEYKTKEEAESEFGIEISDEEWNFCDGLIRRGGFSWDFEI